MKKAKADHQTLDKPNFDLVRRFAMQLPHVEEGTIQGAPSWKLNGKLLDCPPIHKSAEPIPFTRESWCGRIRASRNFVRHWSICRQASMSARS